MRKPIFLVYSVMLVVLHSCAHGIGEGPACPSPISQIAPLTASSSPSADSGQFLIWGMYDLEIARDGSYAKVSQDRSANAAWGVHLNAVKLLEKSPCSNCLSLHNIHVLPDGNLSVDISITHPFDNAYCTGFDVRGILMFPASQYFPDEDLRVENGMDPTGKADWDHRYSSADKGDAELVNAEGWTGIWAPDCKHLGFEVDTGFPIFGYYPGKYASGENLGTLNPFRRFHSTAVRHMFEVGKTVTVTYVIRPPATGPIQASYAIYAHWAPPLQTPVTNPAVDFGPEANSPMPYEYWFSQDEPIDPDKADTNQPDQADPIHCHIKTWDLPGENWRGGLLDILYECSMSIPTWEPHPSGQPDDYVLAGFCTYGYEKIIDGLPGEWPYLIKFIAHKGPTGTSEIVGVDWYIMKIAIEAPDGEW